MSANYLKVLKLATQLSREECILLIKDISSALVDKGESVVINPELEQEMFKSALETRAKILAGEMKSWTLEEAKQRLKPCLPE